VKREPSGALLWGVIVETEAYSQEEPACHGYRRRSPSNETLFGEPGHFYLCVCELWHSPLRECRHGPEELGEWGAAQGAGDSG
jgi:DNA-3-methyladenine glycosylase